MQVKKRWLLIPPALALVLFLGPLARTEAAAKASGPAPAAKPAAAAKSLPQMPGALQVGSILLGVILLGAAVVMGLSKLRDNRAKTSPGNLSLRQSLRLSGRHSLYAVQFEDRLVLLGESDGSLTVLESSADHGMAEDERVLRERDSDDEEGGAVPRDMILPRPGRSPARKRSAPRSGPAAAPTLADFRKLLEKARGSAASR